MAPIVFRTVKGYPADASYPRRPPLPPRIAPSVCLIVRKESWKSWLYVLTVAGPLIEVLCRTYCTDYYPAAGTYSQTPPPSSRRAPSLRFGLPGTLCQPLAQHLVTSRRVLSWNKSVELPEGGLVPAISAPPPPFPIPHSHTDTEAHREEG